jgi:hypothetical protein
MFGFYFREAAELEEHPDLAPSGWPGGDEFSRAFSDALTLRIGEGVLDKTTRSSSNGYFYQSGYWTDSTLSFSAELGQVVWIFVRNMGVVGASLAIETSYRDQQTIQLLPAMSYEFRFDHVRFKAGVAGETPVPWTFYVSTRSSVLHINYTIESTWVPGMPRDDR